MSPELRLQACFVDLGFRLELLTSNLEVCFGSRIALLMLLLAKSLRLPQAQEPLGGYCRSYKFLRVS